MIVEYTLNKDVHEKSEKWKGKYENFSLNLADINFLTLPKTISSMPSAY